MYTALRNLFYAQCNVSGAKSSWADRTRLYCCSRMEVFTTGGQNIHGKYNLTRLTLKT